MQDKSFVAIIKRSGEGFSAIEQIYHPTPSGCDRWIDGLGDNNIYDTEKEALKNFLEFLKECVKSEAIKKYPGLEYRIEFLLEKYQEELKK